MSSLENSKNLFLANFIFGVHLLVVLINLTGWYFESFRWFYIGILSITLLSNLLLDYCPLTRWEFNLRKKINPNSNYGSSFLAQYFLRVFRLDIPAKYKYFRWVVVAFSASLLLINLM